MNHFTYEAQLVLEKARDIAALLRHNYVGTEHILLGCIRVLPCLFEDPEKLARTVHGYLGEGATSCMTGQIPFTPRSKKVIALAGKEAKAQGERSVHVSHFILGMLREAEGVAGRALKDSGQDFSALTRPPSFAGVMDFFSYRS